MYAVGMYVGSHLRQIGVSGIWEEVYLIFIFLNSMDSRWARIITQIKFIRNFLTKSAREILR